MVQEVVTSKLTDTKAAVNELCSKLKKIMIFTIQ